MALFESDLNKCDDRQCLAVRICGKLCLLMKITAISRRKSHLYERRWHLLNLTNDRDLISQMMDARLNRRSENMRKRPIYTSFIPITILAIGAATAISMTSFSAQAQYALCLPVRGCIPTSQASYNVCYQLARERGWRESDNHSVGRGLDRFIFLCLEGRSPR